MNGEDRQKVIRRLLRPARGGIAPDADASGRAKSAAGPAQEEGPKSPARALRRAISRASAGVGLQITTLGIGIEELSLDAALVGLGDGMLILPLAGPGGPGGPVGLIAVDTDYRAALIEAQTLGQPLPRAPDPRPPTLADLALVRPVMVQFLGDLAADARATPLEGWTDGVGVGDAMTDARAAGLSLAAGPYRVVRLTLDLGAGERQGSALVVLPPGGAAPAAAPVAPAEAAGWGRRLQDTVLSAPADLHAVLHRMRLTLTEAEALSPGQVLPLPGVTVASVRIEGPGGRSMTGARLGQVAGMRAVRIEHAAPLQLAQVLPACLPAKPPGQTPDRPSPPAAPTLDL